MSMKPTATILAAAMFVGDRTTPSPLLAGVAAVGLNFTVTTQTHFMLYVSQLAAKKFSYHVGTMQCTVSVDVNSCTVIYNDLHFESHA